MEGCHKVEEEALDAGRNTSFFVMEERFQLNLVPALANPLLAQATAKCNRTHIALTEAIMAL